jgi:hypothetical protein
MKTSHQLMTPFTNARNTYHIHREEKEEEKQHEKAVVEEEIKLKHCAEGNEQKTRHCC